MDFFYTSTDFLLKTVGLRQKPFFISNQIFSLPTPIIRHILSSAYMCNQLKLFKSCKLFRNHYRKFPGLQVQHFIFFDERKYYNNNFEIAGHSLRLCTFYFRENFKRFSILKVKRLSFYNIKLDANEIFYNKLLQEISQTFDFSILKNIDLQFQTICKKQLKPFLVSSLICLKVYFENVVGNEDVLEIILTNASNLKELFCTLQQNTNTLKNSLKIQKSTKLYISYFFGVHVYPSATDVANYIIQHMEPDGRLKFGWRKYSNTSESTLVKYKDEILHLLELKSGTNNYEQFNIFLP